MQIFAWKRILLFAFISFSLAACQTAQKPELGLKKIAAIPEDAIWLDHKYFQVLYSKNNHIAYYSKYQLNAQDISADRVERANSFRADPLLIKLGLSAVDGKDYAKSGYDQGHLAPSGDFRQSKEAENSTYVMSNMIPQKPAFNRTAWRALESKIQDWATCEGSLLVITGPILKKYLPALPTSKTPLPVPEQVFKVIFDLTPPHKAIAFIMSQEDRTTKDHIKSVNKVREVEALTGLNFFSTVENPYAYEKDSPLERWPKKRCAQLNP